jgi:MFS family permease
MNVQVSRLSQVMVRPKKIENIEDVERPLLAIFFLFGFSVMSWIPRFPEVKANLGVTNGDFGILLSMGGAGSLLALFTVGHFVNQFGTKKFLPLSSAGFCLTIAAIVHVQNAWVFLICNIAIGCFISSFHISINAQSLAAQAELQKLLLPKTAGTWTSGALCSILLSSFLVTHLGLELHIGVLQILTLLAIYLQIFKISPHLVTPSVARESILVTLNKVRKFRVDLFFAIVMLCAIQMEFSMADWATIYARENLGSKPQFAALPYLVFLGFMSLGRLNVHRITDSHSEVKLLKLGALLGGGGYCIGVTVSHLLKESPGLAYISFLLSLAFSGLGSSFMAPIFINKAQERSAESSAVVIGQLGVLNNSMAFVVKAVIAGVAEFAGLHVALLIPGVMLFVIVFLSRVLEDKQTKRF